MACVRDKFWMFGVKAHQDDVFFGNRNGRSLMKSRITPAEGAYMLDIPNMIMVGCDGVPAPYSEDAYGYAESFLRMDKVLWSSAGSGGFRAGNEEDFIIKLSEKYPNICGAYMDDVMGMFPREGRAENLRRTIKQISEKLKSAPRPLELYMTWYAHEVGKVPDDVFDPVDGFMFFEWRSTDIPGQREHFELLEKTYPNKKKMLGIYIFDFDGGYGVPVDLMEQQCELALELLHAGRLDGVVVEANSTMGVGFPSEVWLREWLERHKNEEVPD